MTSLLLLTVVAARLRCYSPAVVPDFPHGYKRDGDKRQVPPESIWAQEEAQLLDMLSFGRDKNQHFLPDIDSTQLSITSPIPSSAQLEVRQRCR